MALHSVDFSRALNVDLPLGRIQLRDDDRTVALPAPWLGELFTYLPAPVIEPMAARLAESIVRAVGSMTPDTTTLEADEAAWALSASLALRGMGTAMFERWGPALVLIWRDAPCEGAVWETFSARVVAKVFAQLTGLDVDTVAVGRADRGIRILLASSETCAAVRSHLASGKDWSSALGHLAQTEET